MRISSFVSFLGFVLVLIGAYCPLVVFKIVVNWKHYNLFGLNQPYGITVLLMAVIGILAVILDKRALIKISAYVSFVLVALIFAGVIFQVHNTLGELPFNFLAALFAKAIHFKWGWYLLFAGALLAVGGTFAVKAKAIKRA